MTLIDLATAESQHEAVPYPILPASIHRPVADKRAEYQFPIPKELSDGITISTVLRAAWALIASRMSGSDDVVFVATESTRNTPVPVRVRLTETQRVGEYLQGVQEGTSSTSGKESIAQTLLLVESEGNSSQDGDQVEMYSLRIHIQIQPLRPTIAATAFFDPRVIEPWLAPKLLHRLAFVTHQLSTASPETSLAEIAITPPLDIQQIWEWNSAVPAVVERCIHEIILERTVAHPEAPAVCAWDSELTYRQLDAVASQVAHNLVEAGVGPEKVVPLCFEKSMWTVVAMLAVLKAGGAFVLLDPTLPETRLRNICHQVHATVGITSVSCKSRLSPFTSETIVLCRQTVEAQRAHKTLSQTPKSTPGNAAYIIFTSGSTGEPKGCVVEHRSYCSAAFGHGSILGMSQHTRALQFGSYNFAGAIMEMLMTLIHGGCVCIPSEEDRASNLSQAIGKLGANWAFLTSTVLALLSADSVPSLRTICVGGEPIRSSQIREWASKVHLRQTYGSAETAAVVSSARLDASSPVTSVGKATTARCWLVDPANIDRLVPVGTPGEVVFEGPVIGREYIGQPEKSSATFIDAPSWRAAVGLCTPSTSSRFYRTGDLATYRRDGSIELLGRKDTQVKLRGQRIELGEIEHQARLSSPDVKEVAVELTVVSTRRNRGPQLIGFLVIKDGDSSSGDERRRATIQTVRTALENVLPHYMVPSIFLPISALPLTASGKTDRRRLREIGATISTQQLEELKPKSAGEKKRPPKTQIEQTLHRIWSQVLQIDPGAIGLDDGFFQLGGDSISAMKVVSEARRAGIDLLVADIFRQDTIAQLTSQRSLDAAQVAGDHQFDGAVLVEACVKTALLKEIEDSPACGGIHPDDVEDVYPLNSVQELLVVASMATRHFADYFYIDLGADVELSMLESGCRKTLERFPILRVCFLQLQGKLWQAVLRQVNPVLRVHELCGEMDESFRDFCLSDGRSLSPTQPLAAFILLKHKDKGMRLVLRMSHAQYDGFSAPIMFQSVFDSDKQRASSAGPDFFTFLSYTSTRRSQSIAHWRQVLQGSRLTAIRPRLLSPGNTESSTPELVLVQTEAHLQHRTGKITPATLVRTAWALLLSRLTGASDVVYGQVVSGRNSMLEGVEKVVGCCLNVVPVRVCLSSSTTVSELLHAVQDQFLAMGEADSLGIRDIAESCTDWPASSSVDSILHHRNIDLNPEIYTAGGAVARMQSFEKVAGSPFIFVVSYSRGDRIPIDIVANTHIMTMETANALVRSLAHVVETLVSCMHMSGASAEAILNSCDTAGFLRRDGE